MTRPIQLNGASLPRLSVGKPNYDRTGLHGGIVHLGLGGFHRAHMARYTHDLMQIDAEARSWAIVGVGLQRVDQELLAALAQQDHLYTLVERDAESATATIIGALIASEQLTESADAILRRLDAARIVSLTVTEPGYCLNPASKRLDLEDQAIVRDLHDRAHPRTAIGIVAEGLRRRFQKAALPFTALSCDNIQHNGDVLRRAVIDYAAACDPRFAAWIAEHGRFPNTMVDRITPRTSAAEISDLAAVYGIDDACPVYCERFRQWIIEDKFSSGRPAWERVGVQFVSDVTAYELMKLRLLNTSHLAISGLGRLAGYRLVDQTMADPRFPAFMLQLMERETEPTLAALPGIDLADYKQTLIARFANPNIKDTLDRINADAPVNYLLDPLRDRLAQGGSIDLLALALAAWIKRVRGFDDAGAPVELRHPQAADLQKRAEVGGPDPRPVLALQSLFGELGENPRLIAVTSAWLASLYQLGALQTLDAALKP